MFQQGYMDDQGAYICSGFKRYTLRANVTSDIHKWLQIGLNVSGTHSVQDYPKQDDSTISNVVMFAVRYHLSIRYINVIWQPEHTCWTKTMNVCSIMVSIARTRMQNIICWLPCHTIKSEIKRDAASLRGFIQITPIKVLAYKMSLNIDYNNKTNHNYTNPTYGTGSISGGSVKQIQLPHYRHDFLIMSLIINTRSMMYMISV